MKEMMVKLRFTVSLPALSEGIASMRYGTCCYMLGLSSNSPERREHVGKIWCVPESRMKVITFVLRGSRSCISREGGSVKLKGESDKLVVGEEAH